MNLRALAIALVALFVLCLAAGSARAAAPQDDDARTAAFLPLAHAAWPDSPCADREQVHTHADAAINAMDARDGKYSTARAQPRSCEVWIRSGLTAVAFCIAEVHEIGHLAGYGHTDEPADAHAPDGPQADVMHGPDHMADYPPCRAATAEPLWRQVRQQVLYDLPAPMASWRVACTSMAIHRPRCTATRPGARPRRFVIVRPASGPIIIDPQQAFTAPRSAA